MAAHDIMPFRSAHGGTIKVESHHLTAAQTFHVGEGVALDATGTISLAADDADVTAPTALYGIAAENAEGMASNAAGTTNATNAVRGVWPFDDCAQEWITKNYSDGGAAFGDAAPDLANVGDTVGYAVIATVHGVQLVGTNEDWIITQVLDANKTSVGTSGGTGVWVVFKRIMT